MCVSLCIVAAWTRSVGDLVVDKFLDINYIEPLKSDIKMISLFYFDCLARYIYDTWSD